VESDLFLISRGTNTSSFKTTRFILNNPETPCIASIGEYIYETVEKTPQQHFKDNTTVSALENNSFSLLYHGSHINQWSIDICPLLIQKVQRQLRSYKKALLVNSKVKSTQPPVFL
jgi:hypothetical protein